VAQLLAELARDIAGIAHIGNARTAWRSSPRMLTVRSVKKILIVVMLGGLLLAVFLFA
jgi:hypothetical protein